MEQLLADITNINNLSVNGSNVIITIPKADLLAYIQSLNVTSTANIIRFNSYKTQLATSAASYDTNITNENTNISNNNPLVTLLS